MPIATIALLSRFNSRTACGKLLPISSSPSAFRNRFSTVSGKSAVPCHDLSHVRSDARAVPDWFSTLRHPS